jgi:hypothetical protein
MFLSGMKKSSINPALLLVGSLLATCALAQTEFSGEIVNTNQEGGEKQAKIYSAKDKIRIEPEDAKSNEMGKGAVIINLATQTSTVLMAQQHMYMEMPWQMANRQNRTEWNFFRTGDVENACSDWLQLPQNKGGTCHKVGHDTVNGRSTIKYEGTNAKGESGTVWVDPKLRFPVKWAAKNGSGELRNIQEGSQPASLFEVPSGYTKFDMGGMMRPPQ